MKIRGVAHRGYPLRYPENTLSSYKAAYDLGFTHLELDVHLSKDGVPVLMHDPTIDRMTDGQGWVKDYTLEELRQFRVGRDETIPTLEEALLFAKDKMTVNVELKQYGELYPGLEETVLEILKKTDMLDQVYISSFDHYSIVKMRKLSDEVELGLIQWGATPAVVPFMEEIRARYLSLRTEYLTDEYVKLCERSGIQLMVWPVNLKWQFDKAARYPSVLCVTDDLEGFKEMYQERFQ
ncbi:glycerophosphoryl diester phosphodiesterase [Planifilum fimeticola]|uniref:Glycerophosphoryl diester phosphodiesterase n=1 Tax=Planifilum fimeticola TaxID=201975 RepID=A0A2T0LBF7_9BACL|nr:glycerophosphodiester phosphodiesterase family protein [Planifilum fimeticola]PRX39253.1 glycerophosphoryl diester phosphodiesterase [Planifilum fimeticola]